MQRCRTAVFAFCITSVSPIAGQESVFSLLEGEWHGEGMLMGRSAAYAMTWRHDAGFAVLEFANSFVGTDGQATPVLNSVAVYRASEANPEAVWLDSRGERVEIRWESSDSSLIAHWANSSEEGRTTYRVRAGHELEVVDEVLSGDGWRTFGTARYKKARVPD